MLCDWRLSSDDDVSKDLVDLDKTLEVRTGLFQGISRDECQAG